MSETAYSETLDSERLLCYWRWLCPQSLTVINRNAFGDLFVRDEAGRVHMLDVGSGDFSLIAESVPEFAVLAKTPEKREEWFAERETKAAAERGLVPGPGQCIGFYPPAVSVECEGLNSAYVTDLYDNVGWLGDMHMQIAMLPDGAKVRIVVQPPKNNTRSGFWTVSPPILPQPRHRGDGGSRQTA
jgi:hypothetical protein